MRILIVKKVVSAIPPGRKGEISLRISEYEESKYQR